MEKYRVRIKASAIKEIEAVGEKKLRRLIARRIQALATDPRAEGCQKLSGSEKYRIRQGAYRILYQIEDEILTVFVVRVAHRKEAYRR